MSGRPRQSRQLDIYRRETLSPKVRTQPCSRRYECGQHFLGNITAAGEFTELTEPVERVIHRAFLASPWFHHTTFGDKEDG